MLCFYVLIVHVQIQYLNVFFFTKYVPYGFNLKKQNGRSDDENSMHQLYFTKNRSTIPGVPKKAERTIFVTLIFEKYSIF